MSTFVLVHGAFRGGWAWREVRPLLIAAGHDVHAPSLVGCGELAGLVDRVTGLDVWTDQVAGLLEAEDLDGVVLVGHSQGGLVTASVAAAVPERIVAVVHLDAAVPAPGERAVDLTPTPGPLPERRLTVPPTPGDSAWLDARLTPSPVAPALDPVPGVPTSVREVYAFCADTPEGYPSTATRARLDAQGRDYQLLDCGHDAPLTAPRLVADLLLAQAGIDRQSTAHLQEGHR